VPYEDEQSTEDMATSQAMSGEFPASPVSGYIPPTPLMAPSLSAVPATTAPSTNGNGNGAYHAPVTTVTTSAPAPAPTPAPTADTSGDYSAYVLNVNTPWPPPVFARPSMKPEERFYLENRWFSQWNFYDRKANQSKANYLRLQQIIVIGSVIVPVLVAFGPNLVNIFPDESAIVVRFVIDVITVVISTAVAVAAAWEGLHKYGDSWTTYRRAAEEMQQEKFTFDVRTGRYANNPDAFARFVERCEEIMAQQNGRFIQTIEKQQAQAAEQNQEILAKYNKGDEGTTITVSNPTPTTSVVSVATTAPEPAAMVAAVPMEDSSAG
jgi:hypothetical protein